jgi:hypothetical protein
MAQNFVSYNPMQVGQANAGVIAPSNNKMGQIAFEGAKLGVKREAERRKAELANQPDFAKADINYDIKSGVLNPTYAHAIGLLRKEYSENASGATKSSLNPILSEGKKDADILGLHAQETSDITNKLNDMSKTAIANGDILSAIRINDVYNYGQKANNDLLQTRDKKELFTGLSNVNNELRSRSNKIMGNNVAQDWQAKVPTFLPPADTNGELVQTVSQDPNDANMLIYTTVGGKDVRVPADRWNIAKSNAKLSSPMRNGVLNQYLKNLSGRGIEFDNPAKVSEAYLQDLQSFGYGDDVIAKQAEQLKGIIDNGGSLTDVTNFLYDPNKSPLIDGIIDKQFDAHYHYKKEDINKTSKSNVGGSGSDNKSPEVIPFKVSSKSANGDRVTYNADAVNVANSKIPLASGTAVSASDGSLKKTDPNKEYIAQGVSVTPVYKLSNNKVAPIIPSGSNNQSIHDAMKLYATDDKYGSLTFKVNGKEYTLKDLLISGNISIQPTLIIAESIRRGNTSGDYGLANTTDTGETLLRFITNNEARTYAKSRKTGEANYNNIYKTNNDSFNKAMIRAKSNASKVKSNAPQAKAVNKPAPVTINKNFKFNKNK